MRRAGFSWLSALTAAVAAIVVFNGVGTAAFGGERASGWPQWGQDPQHRGVAPVVGQPAQAMLASVTYDQLAAAEIAGQQSLTLHYQAPLLRGDDVWMELRTGTFTPLAPDASNLATHWNTQVFGEERLAMEDGQLVERWSFQSDWKPEPQNLAQFEPVFHAVLAASSIYVPGLGGTVFQLDAMSGRVRSRIDPFGSAIDPSIYVAGPISADDRGNLYYNALQLSSPTTSSGSWLVRIDRHGRTSMVSFGDLVPNAPTVCLGTFSITQLPWPPSPAAFPPSLPCGIQRAALNVAPAIAPDGTIYTVSKADRSPEYGFVVAVNRDLTPRWAASLRGHLDDGCGVLLPIAPTAAPAADACRNGTTVGVDPLTNQPPAGEVTDASSSSPVVMPDGSVLYGAFGRFNGRGHLMKFGRDGAFQAAFDFGWDSTPAVWQDRRGGEHVVLKDNHYDLPYCPRSRTLAVARIVCVPTAPEPGPFFITQLDVSLQPEWQFQNTNDQLCQRQPDGTVSCTTVPPGGFERCVNAPAVDQRGTVYATSEDGSLYRIEQGHSGVFTQPDGKLFLSGALGAAYTPLAIGEDGQIVTQDLGQLFVVGRGRPVSD
jgi:outer membrane protein assembly factor BamB